MNAAQRLLIKSKAILSAASPAKLTANCTTAAAAKNPQTAAVARALITEPRIILADEPTGALDSKSTDELLRLFTEVNALGQTILMVTHSVKAASSAKRVLFIKDGEVFHQIYRGADTDSQLYQKISETLTLLATGGERK